MEFSHYSVMLKETIEELKVKSDGIYVDGTLGGGGHAYEVCKRLSDTGHFYGIDQDAAAIAAASQRLSEFGNRVTIIRSNYCEMCKELRDRGVTGVDGIVLDLGVSSYQLDEADRGFTYREDAALDMRMDQRQEKTARDIVEVRKLKANLVSVNIDKLVNEGYLVRKNVEGDRRKVQLLCTDKAQPIIRRGQQLQEHFVEQLFADIDDTTRQTIFQGMRQMELNLNLILEDN